MIKIYFFISKFEFHPFDLILSHWWNVCHCSRLKFDINVLNLRVNFPFHGIHHKLQCAICSLSPKATSVVM